MRLPLSENDHSATGGGMSRLDIAKMAVEDIVRVLNKRVNEHNTYLRQHPAKHQALRNIGLGYCPSDDFLLLSTGRQHTQQTATAACGAGGRLLVGYGDHSHEQATDGSKDQPAGQHLSNMDSFQKELKCLQATDWEHGRVGPNNKPIPFPEDGGGSLGLNTAVSVGLQMLSRYRLSFRATENFGMGRLPSLAVLNPSGGPAVHALQPACLIIITDGLCLRSPPAEGGGPLQLQYGNLPLREFYQEPFRWDQRIYCLGVGGNEGVSSTQFFHPHLRALCEVTGGGHMMLRSSGTLAQSTDSLLKKIAPPRPRDLPIPDPLKLQSSHLPLVGAMGTFISGGPVCSLQALEGDMDPAQASPKHRALLLYVPHEQALPSASGSSAGGDIAQDAFQPPTWCIPENFFPSKSLDSLPPRSAQPNLLFSRFPGRLGSKSFEPSLILKALGRLDQLTLSNRKHLLQSQGQTNPSIKLLSRDVYVLEWISTDGKPAKGPVSPMSMDYFPVVVAGAARPSLGEVDASYLNIGILHVPSGTSSLGYSLASGTRVSTLTLLPPEPHILLPLLIRAAEAEHRALKKAMAAEAKDSAAGGPTPAALSKKPAQASRNVHLDEHWRNEFRAYLFRIPPYYQNGLRRSLRSILPVSAHGLLTADGTEGGLASQCFSKICLQKIRNAEQSARESNERLERQEIELRRRGAQTFEFPKSEPQLQNPKRLQNEQANEIAKVLQIGYGQYDPRSSTDSFLAALKGMPAPWRVRNSLSKHPNSDSTETSSKTAGTSARRRAVDALGDLPSNCLMAYYESRRRWIFGGSGLTTRGLYAEGVANDGSNMQRCGAARNRMEESLLSLAGVGVSQMNTTTTARMGDYRERLLWSRAPVVGYGSNDATGVSATTAADGAPKWSVDDDAMPITFFNPRTGEFADSVQARVRSRLMVNFGNPYKDKRADSLIPEQYFTQSPSSKKGLVGSDNDDSTMTPPGSPPHDSYSASEGEGEAVFANPTSRARKSPLRSEPNEKLPLKKQKIQQDSSPEAPISTEEVPKESPPKTQSEQVQPEVPKPPPPPPKASTSVPPPTPSNPPPASIPQPPRPHPKAQPPTKTPMPPGGRPTKSKALGPPVSKAPPQPKPPPKGVLRQISVGDKPPVPQGRPAGVPPPKPPVKPSAAPLPSQPRKPVVPQARKAPLPPAEPAMQSPDRKPNVDLPLGWMSVWSKSQKRWYFFCTKTNKSVWQWPPP